MTGYGQRAEAAILAKLPVRRAIAGAYLLSGLFAGVWGGALFLTLISTAVTALGLSASWQDIVEGVVIVLALSIQGRRRNAAVHGPWPPGGSCPAAGIASPCLAFYPPVGALVSPGL